MARLNLITVPDPLLKTLSKPVERVDDDLRRLMDNMAETMYEAPGIGLAAIQVAEPLRLLVMDTAGDADNPATQFLINPEVTWESEDLNLYNEGCLSVPEHYAEVERPASVKVRYLDYHGKQQEGLFEGLDATCVQHEIDHLNGIVFIDHLSSLRRSMIIKKLKKAQKGVAVL